VKLISLVACGAALLICHAAALGQSQEEYEKLFSPEERQLAIDSLADAQLAAKHLTSVEIRQVFKIQEPTCRRARIAGIKFADSVAKDLKFNLWQQLLLTHVCIVREFGSPSQQASIIALMR
jgi:hypothetical protein